MREILVMDCEERENFWITLRSDYRILFATTAEEGLRMLSENVDLVFLSMRLPDMDSREVLNLIKKAYPSTALIMITACGADETHAEASGRKERDYAGKPLQAEELLQRIRLLLYVDNDPQRRQPVSLPEEPVQDEQYPDVPSHLVPGVLKVRDFVAQNYSESLTLPAACKMSALSKTYFCRFFKSITGYSLRTYHHVVKIQAAEKLLKDKRLPVKDVAQKLGYHDSNYFSTIYKKITGASPKHRKTSVQNLEKNKEVLDRI